MNDRFDCTKMSGRGWCPLTQFCIGLRTENCSVETRAQYDVRYERALAYWRREARAGRGAHVLEPLQRPQPEFEPRERVR